MWLAPWEPTFYPKAAPEVRGGQQRCEGGPCRGPPPLPGCGGAGTGTPGGRGQVKLLPGIPRARLRGEGGCGRLPDTARAWERMTHGSCRQMTEAGNTGDGQERPVISQGKAYTGRLTHTEPRPDNAGAHTHTHTRGGDSLYSLYTEPAPRMGHIPYKQSSLQNRDNLAPTEQPVGEGAEKGKPRSCHPSRMGKGLGGARVGLVRSAFVRGTSVFGRG